MKRFVIGLLFNVTKSEVLLIEKNKPSWQAGKLNGVGGKIEKGETPYSAMVREFREETGEQTTYCRWNLFVTLKGIGWELFVFRAFDSTTFDAARTMEEEELVRIPVSMLVDADVLPNLRWLIPLALDAGVRDVQVMES